MKKTLRGEGRGQSLIEFSLLLPFLIILIGGLTDFGVAFFVSIGLQNAVREGAREAATTQTLTSNDAGVHSAVVEQIPAISYFTNIAVTNTPPSDTTCTAEVTVTASGTYNFTFLTYIGFSSIPISRSTTMRYEGGPLCTT